MSSTIFLSVASLCFVIMIIFVYFTKDKIDTSENRVFTKLLLVSFFSLISEICIVIMPKDMTFLPFVISMKLYLVLCILWISYFMEYVFIVTRNNDNGKITNYRKNYKKTYITFWTITILILLLVLLLPINFYNENGLKYSYGPSVDVVFALTGIYTSIMSFYIIKNMKNIKKKGYLPIIILVVLLLLTAVVQKINPGLLLANMSFALITVLMYHTIENPDEKMLREVHKAKEISDNANEEKAMFLYNMTNEIRKTTKEIDSFANYILEETENKKINIEVINDSVREIKNSTARFNTMTNQILDISQIDSANIRVYNDKYNIKLIIKEIISKYKKDSINKNLDFRTSIASDIPDYLYGDSVGLKNVLTIILDNSIKYTNEGYIEFSVNTIMRRDVCRLIISIEDTGSGIKAENLETIFSKKEEDTEEDRHNLDNNLYNAKRLITLMGGTIIPTSVYDKGTTIKIVLDQKVVNKNDTDLNKYEEVYDKKKILLVDDNPYSTKIINKLLDDTNIELESVSLGSECLDKIRKKEKYDLILIDEEMKPLDGITIMKKLKEIRTFNTKVILLTHNNDYEYNDDYLKLGFSDHILKPINKEKLIEKIDKCLR